MSSVAVLSRISEQIKALESEIEANAGKRGNPQRRAQLETLNKKSYTARFFHSRVQENLASQNLPNPRSSSKPEHTRERIAAASKRDVYRDSWGALTCPRDVEDLLREVKITHPLLAKFAAWKNANEVKRRAVDFGILDEAGIVDTGSSRRRSRWASVNHSIYSYSANGKLAVIQQRECESDGKYTNLKIRYFVTDGENAIELQNGKKQSVKRAAAADAAPDSPLRALRSILPEDWQALVDDKPVKFPAFGGEIKSPTVDKRMRCRSNRLSNI
jgi:hypothetical protein